MRKFTIFILLIALSVLPFSGSAQQEVYTDNVVIVLDTSGSMKAKMRSGVSRMDAAKSALKEVMKTIPESTHVGVLVFRGQKDRKTWLYQLGKRNDAQLMRAINKPNPIGGTPLGEFIKKGADQLLKVRDKQHGYGSYRLLVVTDGEAGDKNLVEQYVPEVKARGITIDVIGVDLKKDHTLATKVHSYRSADNPESLKQAVAEVFAEVSGTGQGGVDDDSFQLIAPLPYEMAQEVIEALSRSGNDPIGSTKRRSPQQSSTHKKKVNSQSKKVARNNSDSGISPMAIVFGVGILATIVSTFAKKK